MKLLLPTLTISLLSLASATDEGLEWTPLKVTLPKALSDHTAATSDDGIIYIAGGCDDPNGNSYIPDEEGEGGFFACGSISSNLYSFNPESLAFETLTDLPRARYRHSSAIVNNQLWLVGGRTLVDNLISDVDVFDLSSKEWTTYSLPQDYVVSDHAGFGKAPSSVYVIGGYNAVYEAQSRVYKIDASAPNATLAVEEVASLAEGRGDIIGVVDSDGKFAYIAGGFTHENGFCEPLSTTEEYNFEANEWSARPDLLNDRGEIVLVELNDNLYAMGGERQIEDICEQTGGETDPGELTVGVGVVEVLGSSSESWELISSFPEHKFRFAASTVQAKNEIFVFGGQSAYDDSCSCFKTTTDVLVFTLETSSAYATSFRVFAVIGILGTILMF